MNAEEAREKSIQGAIKAIEKMIAEATSRGDYSLDLSDYSIADSFDESVENYFVENGFNVDHYEISWKK